MLIDGTDISRSPAVQRWLAARSGRFTELVSLGALSSLTATVRNAVVGLLR
ncbi:MAG: hypothetical protein ACRD1K_01765 [Acidimicrobiales bacterium]